MIDIDIYIGLGANLGATANTVREAAAALARMPGIEGLHLSPLYRTAPVDSAGPDYVNAVAHARTRLAPQAILALLQTIEQDHGRQRPYRNAPRTLDLDLLLYGDQQIDEPTLTVPHPRLHERAFVLRPLADLAPKLVLAQGHIADLLAQCAGQAIQPLEEPPQMSPSRSGTHREDCLADENINSVAPTGRHMTTPSIRIVVAYTSNRVIGRDRGMPWHLPSDLAHFKRSTLGHPIIMGRKTWQTLGRPLPGRRNLVLSRSVGFEAPGAEILPTLQAALDHCARDATVCVIGGEQIFRLALPLADELIATEIHTTLEGDTWFPELPAGQWQEVERLPQAAENGLSFDFVTYRRVSMGPSPGQD